MDSLFRTLGVVAVATALVATSPVSASSSPSARVPGVAETDGDIRLLDEPPESVVLGDLESDDDLFLFAERRNVTLAGPVAVDIVGPVEWFV